MKQFIKSMSARTKNIVFGGIYALLVLAAIFPPLYFSASGNGALVLGAPIAMWYWIADFALLIAMMFTLYWVESIRNEVDCEPAAVTAGGE
ncbi:MAG: hypothetical protein Q4Q56_01230 [Coriobacteriia bacterium]|nr:hypothetical protein [Coriobacteriia bacterium]